MAEAAKWYVVHTYSGYENTVKATIEKTIETRHLEDLIHVVSIPMETVTEEVEKRVKVSEPSEPARYEFKRVSKTYERKIFPGYVLIKMIMSDDAWHIIKNIRGVTGFVGDGNKPTPLTEEEVIQMNVEKHEIILSYGVGDTVTITGGPLTSFTGVVDELDIDKNIVRVIVSMFAGREQRVELELDQVEPIEY